MPNKKTRLANRAARAHARALKRGDTQVGTRRVLNYSNPRGLGGGVSTVPVYKREKKILKKISNLKTKTPKVKKPKVWDPNKRKKPPKNRNKKTKAEKASCNFTKKRNNQRQRRRDPSCK